MTTKLNMFIASILCTFLFIVPSFAATGSGNISNVMNVGGVPSSAPGSVIPLGGGSNERNYLTLSCTGIGTINYAAFYALGIKTGSAGNQYQVGSGKTFQAIGMNLVDLGTDSKMQLGTATAGFTNGQGSAPTGAVYWGGGATTASWNFFAGHTAGTPLYEPITFQISQNLYPFCLNMDGASKFAIQVYGYEF